MYFVGVDLAWAGRNPTGVAAVDADGCLVGVGAARDDASVLAALRPYVVGDCLVAFDAPLVVANRTGQRPAEAALNRDFRQFEAARIRPTPKSPSLPTFHAPPGWPANWRWIWILFRPPRGGPSRSIRTRLRWRCFGYPAR